MSKKSDITGLKHLSGLRNLRWSGAGDFNLDLSGFPVLEELNIGYGSKITGWDKLTTLKKLLIGGFKMNDLSLLKYAVHLEYLRVIGGSITSIIGIEDCKDLKTLFLQKCSSLMYLQPTIASLVNLEQLNLEGCKKIDIEGQLKGMTTKNFSLIK